MSTTQPTDSQTQQTGTTASANNEQALDHVADLLKQIDNDGGGEEGQQHPTSSSSALAVENDKSREDKEGSAPSPRSRGPKTVDSGFLGLTVDVEGGDDSQEKSGLAAPPGITTSGDNFTPKSSSMTPKGGGAYSPTYTNVFIAGIPAGWHEQNLIDLCQPFGEILSIKLVLNRHYAFIQYKDQKAADGAIAALHGKKSTTSGGTLHVALAMHDEGAEEEAGDRLFIRGLPPWMSRDELKKLFVPFGVINECTVLYMSDGQCKGVAFVQYNEIEMATSAKDALNGKKLEQWNFPMEIRYAETNAVRAVRQARNRERMIKSGSGTPGTTPTNRQVVAGGGNPSVLAPGLTPMGSSGHPTPLGGSGSGIVLPMMPPSGSSMVAPPALRSPTNAAGMTGPPPPFGAQQQSPYVGTNVQTQVLEHAPRQIPVNVNLPSPAHGLQVGQPARMLPIVPQQQVAGGPPLQQQQLTSLPQQQQIIQPQQQTLLLGQPLTPQGMTVHTQQQLPIAKTTSPQHSVGGVVPQQQIMFQQQQQQLTTGQAVLPPSQPISTPQPIPQPLPRQSPPLSSPQSAATTTTFPASGDLLMHSAPLTADLASQLVARFGPVEQMGSVPNNGGMVIRMQDRSQHSQIATQLTGVVFSTGHVLQVALIQV